LRWDDADRQAIIPKLRLALTALIERLNPFEEQWRNSFLASRELVRVGKNCSIDPTAIIHGPTVIGDNVYIGPGVVITNSLIGNNVNIMQGSQVMLSVISDRCFLPFRSGVFMSSLMENSMLAQNSTLQFCVTGRNTFIGANTVFTDFNLIGEPIRTFYRGHMREVGVPVIGSAVGHNCKIGSGFVFYPGRMIGSNTVLILDNLVNLVSRNVNAPPHMLPFTPVPGGADELHMPDDVKRLVYHWPYVVNPETGELHDPAEIYRNYPGRYGPDGAVAEPAPEPVSEPDEPPDTPSGNALPDGDRGNRARRTAPPRTNDTHEDDMAEQDADAQEVHVGG
jgi:carbonic anhydrase/acetyltransferase-like protein (isoleucine patch superfamily)